jgi:hypothetical protein
MRFVVAVNRLRLFRVVALSLFQLERNAVANPAAIIHSTQYGRSASLSVMLPVEVLLPALRTTPVNDPARALATMQALELALVPNADTPADGIAWFNRLYMEVTTSVIAAIAAGRFENPEYIVALDVAFANHYFAALLSFVEHLPDVPRAWWPLLSGRERTDVAPIQFAFAGMNAHVNRDLPVALAELWATESAALPPRDVQKQDYLVMNGVLGEVEVRVKGWFLNGDWQTLDREFRGVDDIIASFSLAEAREAAWSQGEALRALGGITTRVGASYLEALDGIVGLATRGLLIRTRF